MKIFTYLLALPAFILPALAAPAQETALVAPLPPDNAVIAQRANEGAAAQNPTLAVQALLGAVKEKDARINATLAGLTKWSPAGQKNPACDIVSEILQEILGLVEGLVGELLGAISCTRGSHVVLRNLLCELVQEISCTLKSVLSILGLNSILKPIVKALLMEVFGLVKCLLCLVDGLLAEVKGLVSGILGGLLGGLLDGILGPLGLQGW